MLAAIHGGVCVLSKPSTLRGTAIYNHSEEDNHVLPLCLYNLHLYSETDYGVEIWHCARNAV